MRPRINKKVALVTLNVFLKRLSEYVFHTVSHHPEFLMCRLQDLVFLSVTVFSRDTERRSNIDRSETLSSVSLRFDKSLNRRNIL